MSDPAPYGQAAYGSGPVPPTGVAEPPPPVRRAVLITYVLAALAVVAAIITIASAGSAVDSVTTTGSGVSTGALKTGVVVGAIFGAVVGAALWIVFGVFTGRGRNWARIVVLVLAALQGLGSLAGIIRVRLSSIVSVVDLVLCVLLFVFLLSAPARAFFAARRPGYDGGYGGGYGGPAQGPADPGYPPGPPVQ